MMPMPAQVRTLDEDNFGDFQERAGKFFGSWRFTNNYIVHYGADWIPCQRSLNFCGLFRFEDKALIYLRDICKRRIIEEIKFEENPRFAFYWNVDGDGQNNLHGVDRFFYLDMGRHGIAKIWEGVEFFGSSEKRRT